MYTCPECGSNALKPLEDERLVRLVVRIYDDDEVLECLNCETLIYESQAIYEVDDEWPGDDEDDDEDIAF